MHRDKNNSTERLELRKTLLYNGYRPIPLIDKGTRIKGWTRAEIDEDWLKKHSRSATAANTGIRCDDLIAFDIDVTDEEIADEIEAAIEELCGPTDFCRVGHWPKRLLLYRLAGETTRSARTGKFNGHQVELLATAGRQFAAFGIHPGTGKPYQWEGLNPLHHAIDKVPEITGKLALDVLQSIEVGLGQHFERDSPGSTLGMQGAQEYDLTDDTMIEDGGIVRAWANIVEELDERGIWCNLMRENGEFGDSYACHAYIAQGTGQPCIHDFVRDVTHWAAIVPTDYAEVVPEADDSGTDMFDPECLVELIENYVLIDDKTVRPIDHPEHIASFDGFKLNHSHWQVPAPTRQNPNRTINAVDAWAKDARCVRASKAALRPDYPDDALLTEGRIRVFNTYNPPLHPTEGGECATALEFIEHLVPNPADRDIFLEWHAHKVANPGDRMHGLAMVTPSYGVGRGTWIQILRSLFGYFYVTEIPLSQLVGRGGQSEFNQYLADSLVVSVPEALEEREEQTKWQARHLAYEQLKLVVDPISQPVQIRRKYGRNSIEQCYASIIISSNHTDALAMEAEDRRMIVLDNGVIPLVNAESNLYDRIHQWKLKPENIGALQRHFLVEYEASQYNPFGIPPMTHAKQLMINQSRSDTDLLFDRFIEQAKGDIATHAQWRIWAYKQRLTLDLDLPHDPQKLDAALAAVITQRGSRVASLPSSGLKIDKQVVRPWIVRNAEKWKDCEDRAAIRAEIAKNGEVGGKTIDINALR